MQLRLKTWDMGKPIWSVWDSKNGFCGYVETCRGGFVGFDAYSLAPTLTKVGRYNSKADAAKAVCSNFINS